MSWNRTAAPLWFAVLAGLITCLAWTADEPVILGLWEALDVTGSMWSHWWTADALSRMASPFAGTHSYLPTGLNPVLQYNLLDAIIHAPFILLFGPHTGYNLALSFALFATGWSSYSLARAAGRTAAASIFAGTLVQASSIVLIEAHEGRISQVTLVFFVLALREWVRMLKDGPSPARGLRLGLLAAGTALVYWYHGFALLLALTTLAWAQRDRLNTDWIKPLVISAAVGGALTIPFVIDLLSDWQQLPGVTRLHDIDTLALDMDSRKSGMTVATDNSRWPLWPFMRNEGQDYGHQLSFVAVLFCIVSLRHKLRSVLGWLAVAATGWLLALGPVLQGWDQATTIPMPFGLLQDWVPTFSRMWWPQRFEVLTAIGVAMAAAAGLDHWLKHRSKRRLWAAGAVMLCVIDAPVRSDIGPIAVTPTPPSTPALYSTIDGPILTVPVLPGIGEAMRLQWNQTVHGHPTQNGDGEHIPSHRPPGFTDFMESNGLISALQTLHASDSVDATVSPEDIQQLIDGGFRYAVTDPSVFSSKGRARAVAHSEVFEAVWGPPVHRHRGGAVWTMTSLDAPVTVSASLRSGRERRRR